MRDRLGTLRGSYPRVMKVIQGLKESWETFAIIVSSIAGVLALISTLYAYAKAIVRLNGLGRRLRVVEETQTKQDQRMTGIQHDQERASDDRQRLHEEVARSAKASEVATDTMDQARAVIVGEINTMRLDLINKMGQLGERVKGVEVEMRIRNQGDRP